MNCTVCGISSGLQDEGTCQSARVTRDCAYDPHWPGMTRIRIANTHSAWAGTDPHKFPKVRSDAHSEAFSWEAGRTLLLFLMKRRWWENNQRQWGWAGSRLEELGGEAETEVGFQKNMLLYVCRKLGQKCIEGLGKNWLIGTTTTTKQPDFLGRSRSWCRESFPLPLIASRSWGFFQMESGEEATDFKLPFTEKKMLDFLLRPVLQLVSSVSMMQ